MWYIIWSLLTASEENSTCNFYYLISIFRLNNLATKNILPKLMISVFVFLKDFLLNSVVSISFNQSFIVSERYWSLPPAGLQCYVILNSCFWRLPFSFNLLLKPSHCFELAFQGSDLQRTLASFVDIPSLVRLIVGDILESAMADENKLGW